jgi:hypothetical protein
MHPFQHFVQALGLLVFFMQDGYIKKGETIMFLCVYILYVVVVVVYEHITVKRRAARQEEHEKNPLLFAKRSHSPDGSHGQSTSEMVPLLNRNTASYGGNALAATKLSFGDRGCGGEALLAVPPTPVPFRILKSGGGAEANSWIEPALSTTDFSTFDDTVQCSFSAPWIWPSQPTVDPLASWCL